MRHRSQHDAQWKSCESTRRPGAQITTNNVTINPFNGGSIGGLAETNGTITFSSGSSINGNWATAASAQTGGQIIFQSGSAINPPFGGGVTALLANGVGPDGQASHIIATGLAVNMNGAGGNVAGKATGGGIITLNSGTTINFAAGAAAIPDFGRQEQAARSSPSAPT